MQHNALTYITRLKTEKKSTEVIATSPDALLSEILEKYQQLANSNPDQLRYNIPSTDIWRFFVDGNRQNNNRHLKSVSPFTEQDLQYHHYTIEAYIKQVEHLDPKKEIGKSRLIKILNIAEMHITDQELNELKIIDLINMDKAWLAFERKEPGYLNALTAAFQLIFTHKKPVTLDFIKTLHLVATSNVDNLNTIAGDQLDNFRTTPCMKVSLNANNTTVAGICEFYNRLQKKADCPNNIISIDLGIMPPAYSSFINVTQLVATILNNDQFNHLSEAKLYDYFKTNWGCNGASIADEQIKPMIPLIMTLRTTYNKNQLFQTLYNEIIHDKHYHLSSAQPTNVRNENNIQLSILLDRYYLNEKYYKQRHPCKLSLLKTIIEFIQHAEQQHPFIDANCRTFCMLLLNHLLIQNGFPLVILENPNQFDLHSQDELLIAVLKGMQNTLTLMQTGSLYDIKTADVLEKLRNDPKQKKEYDYINKIVSREEAIRHQTVSSNNFFAATNNTKIINNYEATKDSMKTSMTM